MTNHCWQCESSDVVVDTGIRYWCDKCAKEANLEGIRYIIDVNSQNPLNSLNSQTKIH